MGLPADIKPQSEIPQPKDWAFIRTADDFHLVDLVKTDLWLNAHATRLASPSKHFYLKGSD
jgi:hypothetical protein